MQRKPDRTKSPIPVPNGDFILWLRIVAKAMYEELERRKAQKN